MRILGSKFLAWYPATFIVTVFGLGYITWWREAWLAIFTAICILALNYILTPLITHSHPTMVDHGVILLRVAIIMFPVGWFSLAVYEARRGENEPIIIDYFFGIFLTIVLVLPSILYASRFLDVLTGYVCGVFIECVDATHLLGEVLAFAIPCVMYTFILKWQIRPIDTIRKEIRTSLGNFLAVLVAVGYTVVLFSALVFFFMRGDFGVMADYLTEVFSRLVPMLWQSHLDTVFQGHGSI